MVNERRDFVATQQNRHFPTGNILGVDEAYPASVRHNEPSTSGAPPLFADPMRYNEPSASEVPLLFDDPMCYNESSTSDALLPLDDSVRHMMMHPPPFHAFLPRSCACTQCRPSHLISQETVTNAPVGYY